MLKKVTWLAAFFAMLLPLAFSSPAQAREEGLWKSTESLPTCNGHARPLPEKQSVFMRAVMEKAEAKNKPLHDKVHALHAELADILTAPKFDKIKFYGKKKELIGLEAQMHANVAKAFTDAAAKLSQEDRKALAEEVRRWHGSHPHFAPGDEPHMD